MDRMALLQTLSDLKPTRLGKFLYYCLPYRRRVVLSNMHLVFGSLLSPQEIKHLAQCFYSHLGLSLKENIGMRFMREDRLIEKARVVGHEIVLRLTEQKKGLLILTGHFGNWEFAPIAGILNFKQFKGRFYFVRKTLKNKFLERLLFRRYYRAGLHVIPKRNSLNAVCEALENNHAVVFVMDQHASVHSKEGIMVDFFGKKAGTYRSLAMLAKYTGAPVVPAQTYRDEQGQHVLQFFDAIAFEEKEEWNKQETLIHNTRAYNEALERMILLHPDQWLWMHKRWKA